MPTDLLPTRTPSRSAENVSRGLAVSVAGHAALVIGLLGAAWLSHRLDPHWGESDPTVGSIQASMVNSLPLPAKQRFKENSVLTSDKPSIAPTPPPPTPAPVSKAAPAQPKAEPLPRPNEILLPKKTVTPTKPADREQPVATKRVTPPPAPTPKATTGETDGIQIPQSITQLRNGTASVTVEQRAFGDRYAYYVRLISKKINESKQQDTDGPDAKGKKAIIRFTIDRDGVPTDVSVATRSGSAALDTSTMRAIQRIDTFGPLPAGNSLPVTFEWDSR
jgi:protein TonB